MSSQMLSLLADIVLMIHAGVVLFIVGGQLLILFGWLRRWTWPRNFPFRLTHLVAIAYVVLESWLGVACPLTVWEYKLRRLAGETAHDMGFIAYWLQQLLFYSAPPWVFTLMYTLFGLLVFVSYIAYPPQKFRRRQ